MKNSLLFIPIALLLFFSYSKESDFNAPELKEGTGTVWLSGGLYQCAEQIHLDD